MEILTPMNAVIACGGTGGHLFPGLAVAEVLRGRGHEVLLFISEKEIDTLALEGRTDFRFEKLPTVALPSPFSPAILAFVRRFNESLSLCRGIFRKFNPQVVLGMGGFTSTAPVHCRPDARHPDLHSRIECRSRKSEPPHGALCARCSPRFQGMRAFFPKARTEFTGTPIRSTLQPNRSRGSARKARTATGVADAARDGREPGRERDQSGVDQSDAFVAGLPLQVIHLAGSSR